MLAELGWRYYPSASFYFLPTRAWEILTGSLAAMYLNKNGVRSNNYMSSIGILLIALAVFLFDQDTPYPSFFTLIPVAGVLLVILFAESNTFISKVLSSKFLVSLGLISYSAYLWHHPVFAFARIRTFHEPSSQVMILLICLSLILAIITWRFIEQPFRNKKNFSQKQIFIFAICGITLFSVIGVQGHKSWGFPERINGWSNLKDIPTAATSYCHTSGKRSTDQLKQKNFCLIGEGETSLAIIGDSHAGALFEYADQALKKRNISAIAQSGGYCAPLLNGFDAGNYCTNDLEIAFNYIINEKDIEVVVLAAEWGLYTSGFRENDPPGLWVDNLGKAQKPTDNKIIFERSFKETIASLAAANKNNSNSSSSRVSRASL